VRGHPVAAWRTRWNGGRNGCGEGGGRGEGGRGWGGAAGGGERGCCLAVRE
jgi:hypothetical protein